MDLEKNAIEIIKTYQGEEPYQLGYSGGKDSDVILHIARKCGARYEAIHNLTTVDAPETVYHVKKQPDVKIIKPEFNMWQLIVKNGMPPTRLARYCCKELKEKGGLGKKLITGVRWEESESRREKQGLVTFPKPSKDVKQIVDNQSVKQTKQGGVVILNMDNADTRRTVESCYRTSKTLVNPIINWDDEFLWWYIKHEEIEVNPLYSQGYCRVGCIGCPMAGKERWKQFERYPMYKRSYIRAFDKMIETRKEKGLPVAEEWKTGNDVFLWWMEDKNIPGQMELSEFMDY